jgi:hypothetical protein
MDRAIQNQLANCSGRAFKYFCPFCCEAGNLKSNFKMGGYNLMVSKYKVFLLGAIPLFFPAILTIFNC